MSKISFFQRFSQRENHATNNTLLLLRHVYLSAPEKLESVLSDLADSELSIGLEFEQQKREAYSVPDALITQRPVRIYFETKTGPDLDDDQIRRHVESIAPQARSGARCILFGLTTLGLTEDRLQELAANTAGSSVLFVPITFAQIVEALRSTLAPHDVELNDILGDYEQYLIEEGLLPREDKMTVVPCGQSLAVNKEFGLYYEPSDRWSKVTSRYLGLYHRKKVQYLGEIVAVYVGQMVDGDFKIVQSEKSRSSIEDIEKITRAIKASSTYYPNLGNEEHRYYLVDDFHMTDIRKTSKGGIWGPRVFYLSDWLTNEKNSDLVSGAVLADRLQGKTFE